MNRALFIISLQHELAMAIGDDLDLKLMLKHFIRVCFKRLNLSSAHVYIHKNADGVPIIINDAGSYQTEHFLSIPTKTKGILWHETSVFITLSKQLIKSNKDVKIQQDNNRFLYGFILPDHGIIIFESLFEFEPEIEKALKPIFQKLSKSCYTNIVYDSLLIEMSARECAEKDASFQANHDVLTGLFNREHFKKLLEEKYFLALDNNTLGCVLLLGVNSFKHINDVMGHSIGDGVLSTFGKRIQELLSEDQYAARFSGDEFIILLSNLPVDEEEADNVVGNFIAQLYEYINTPVRVAANVVKLTCSLGYHLFPHHQSQLNDIIPFADIAMHEAKRVDAIDGVKYETVMSDKIKLKNDYIVEIEEALKNNEFSLHYQPQYNCSREVIGAEALLRWNHPTRGMVPPDVYIPIAEESDLILDIGLWVLEQACRDIKVLELIGLPRSFKKLSINVSPKQLLQYDFKELVLSNIEKNDIPANLLGLEITENLLVESFDSTISLIESLKEHHIECSIDDFGTGYSSLTYLKRIPASLLKIDRSFVTNIHKESEGIAIAKMIIGLGDALSMDVLAEGVETEEELQCLISLGCYQYQGYFFSKPVAFQEFITRLKAEPNQFD